MNQGQGYLLRWKGRQFGPYSLAAIEQKLEDHEIGMLHEVLVGNRWTTLGTWLDQQSAWNVSDAPKAGPAPSPHSPERQPPMRPRPVLIPEPEASRLAEPDDRDEKSPAPGAGVRAEGSEASAVVRAGEPKSRPGRWVFAILGMATGYLGIHNFYAGYWTRGASQLALSALTTWLGLGWFPSWAWALAEVVCVRRDGRGLEMR
jgi:hypothetical protein